MNNLAIKQTKLDVIYTEQGKKRESRYYCGVGDVGLRV
jgi:hypothetical protein